MDDTEIIPVNQVNYLGVTIDRHLSFGKHVTRACEKAKKTLKTLNALLPNRSGPSNKKRTILVGNAIYDYVRVPHMDEDSRNGQVQNTR